MGGRARGTTQPMPETQSQGRSLEIRCQTCGATVTVAPELRTAECPYCASPSVVERTPEPDRPRPVFVLGFGLDHEHAAQIARRWLASRGIFAHAGLRKAAFEKTRGVYLPAYLYGASAEARYTAEIGEDYTETETYTTTDSKGNTQTHTRVVTKTEWRDLAGEWASYVTDVVVTASRGIANQELEAVEPFDWRALRRYTPAVISGWIAEEASLTRHECLALAHDETVARVGRELAAFMPGDSHRALDYEVVVREESAELVLLPLWVFAVRYAEAKPPVRVLINGQTGKVAGKVPLSWPRIALAIVLGLALVAWIVVLVAVAS